MAQSEEDEPALLMVSNCGKRGHLSRNCQLSEKAHVAQSEEDESALFMVSNCGKRGHLSRNCWSKLRNKKKAKKAHVAQSEEDEPALFMVSACVPNFDSKSTEMEAIDDDVEPEKELQLGVAKMAPAGEPIQLEEERVFAQIDKRDKQHKHRRWILDTGATNHMTEARSTFSELNSGIRGTVNFGDGSVVEIEGCNTILFVSKGGEYCKLTNVYFIPRLKANLVSLGQLDETGCFISIERGLLKICDNQRRLLTQARRTTNRLYILELEIEQPISLSASPKRYLGGGMQGTGT